MTENSRICPWCSSPVPAGVNTCPSCHAVVESPAVADIPGVTQVDPTVKHGVPDEGRLPDDLDPMAMWHAGHDGTPADDHAFDPPSDAVRLEMHKMELAAEMMNAGEAVMSATDNESEPAGAPSDEAIEAARAGLLDDVLSPADREELAERIRIWDAQQSQDDLPDTSKE